MPVIPNVPAFQWEPAAGSQAFLAAQAALAASGVNCALATLAGVGGDAFKFVYDNAPVFEPLRDLRPFDTLARAIATLGLRAEWVPDATLDHVRGQMEAQVGVRQPVLTSFLPGEDYQGCFLLVGYDEAGDTLSYQRAYKTPQADTPYRTLKLQDGVTHWDGPLCGDPDWGDFPMLVLRGPLHNPPDRRAQRQAALEAALTMMQGETLAYPTHPGAQGYAQVPLAERRVPQGIPALELLAQDLGEADLAAFSTLWRLEAQLNQLAWDRGLAVVYLGSWEGDAPAELIAQYRTIGHTARTLASRFWEKRSAAMDCVDDLWLFIRGTSAALYALPTGKKFQDGVADMGQRLETPWGAALLLDEPKRRQKVVELAGKLLDLNRACVPLLQTAVMSL